MPEKVLLIGYGNPGRMDDGLGPALAEAIEGRRIAGLTVDSDYQLTVEDAAAVAEHDAVVFADASVSDPAPFRFYRLADSGNVVGFSTHSVEPGDLMTLAREMFKCRTRAYVLAIRGYEFNEFGEVLSAGARENLDQAVTFMEGVLRNGLLEDAAGACVTGDSSGKLTEE